MTRMMPRVIAASAMFDSEPKSVAARRRRPPSSSPPGSSEIPMTVITDPVTTGGKKCSSRAEHRRRARSRPDRRPGWRRRWPAGRPLRRRRPYPTASIEATAANEVPCTIGSFAPIHWTPRVCSRVARPDTSSVAASR